MPESPEVEALVEELDARLTGRVITAVDVVEFRTTKTRSRPPTALVGARVDGATRHGKYIDLGTSGGRLVVSLGRHGWARWRDGSAGTAPPVLLSLSFDDEEVLDLTDAGSWVSLSTWVVDDPREVPGVAKLGPDPAASGFTRADFDPAFAGRRKQLKAVLQEQESLAGIGNAYSDEILFAARMSPVMLASQLTEDERERLFRATVEVITHAIDARRGIPLDRLKAAKVAAMQVHGRTGEPCPGCDDTVRDFSFASTTAQYCPACQTGGELLPLKA